MNYYERHLGDYARDTAHLTMLEHGAYCLLLDRYYSTEVGIQADHVHRLARVRTAAERAAVDAVLAEFFTLVDGLWINGRASREIEKAQSKINAARTNGTRGGRPKRNPDPTQPKPNGLSPGSETETQAKAHQIPDTRHQTPERASVAVPPPSGARALGSPNPENPTPTPTPTPTPAGAVCLAIRQRGMADVNPADPRLLALLEQGATRDEIAAVAGEAVDKGKGWAWVLHVVAARRADAANLQLAAPTQRSASNGVPSFDESQTYLREQAEHRAVPVPPEVLAKLRSVVKVAS